MSKADELKAKNGNLFERNTILLNENERLKGYLELWESGGCRATNLFECGVVKELKEQLTKAKEILQLFLKLKITPCASGNSINMFQFENLFKQAEQFLEKVK